MRTLVTGGAGFIGSHLVDALVQRGDGVTVLDNLSTGIREQVNPEARLIVGDVRTFVPGEFDLICHLAAQIDVSRSVRDPESDAETNVLGTLRMAQFAYSRAARFVNISSSAVYGTPDSVPLRETEPTRPMSPYGVSKLAGEAYTRMYGWMEAAPPMNSLRLANVYGPRQSTSKGEGAVIAAFRHAVENGQPLKIYGSGKQTRDFIHVFDVVSAVLKVASLDSRGLVWNVGTGVETSILDLADFLKQPTVLEDARPGDLDRSALDSSLLQAAGWRPVIDIRTGMELS